MIHPSLLTRKIIHIDMDAFYASVEVLDNPALAGLPLIVGGSPAGRGVVATASYEARKFGIRSAMPAARAKSLCPDAVFVKPRFQRYVAISDDIRAIFRRHTDKLEPLSLDEAYLDVTGRDLYAVEIAKRIRASIKEELGLTASAGVAPNKMLAKVASELNKPDGLAVILPKDVATFMQRLPVRKINGVGPATTKRLAAFGIETCGDVLERGAAALTEQFGNFGRWLHMRSLGIDERDVGGRRERKSMGHERTFSQDLATHAAMAGELETLATRLSEDLKRKEMRGRTVTLRVKYTNFERSSRATTLAAPTDDPLVLRDAAIAMLKATEVDRRAVRLLGIAVTKLSAGEGGSAIPNANGRQLSLFGD